VEDTEAEPVEVVVHGRQVVHVEHHGRPSAGAVLRFHARRAAGEDEWRYRSRDLRGISFPSALVELNRREARDRFAPPLRFDLVRFDARKGKSSTNRGTRATSMIFSVRRWRWRCDLFKPLSCGASQAWGRYSSEK